MSGPNDALIGQNDSASPKSTDLTWLRGQWAGDPAGKNLTRETAKAHITLA